MADPAVPRDDMDEDATNEANEHILRMLLRPPFTEAETRIAIRDVRLVVESMVSEVSFIDAFPNTIAPTISQEVMFLKLLRMVLDEYGLSVDYRINGREYPAYKICNRARIPIKDDESSVGYGPWCNSGCSVM